MSYHFPLLCPWQTSPIDHSTFPHWTSESFLTYCSRQPLPLNWNDLLSQIWPTPINFWIEILRPREEPLFIPNFIACQRQSPGHHAGHLVYVPKLEGNFLEIIFNMKSHSQKVIFLKKIFRYFWLLQKILIICSQRQLTSKMSSGIRPLLAARKLLNRPNLAIKRPRRTSCLWGDQKTVQQK